MKCLSTSHVAGGTLIEKMKRNKNLLINYFKGVPLQGTSDVLFIIFF